MVNTFSSHTAIVTFVRACNYGAVLQCYALAATLRKLGTFPTVIDYWPDYFRRRYYLDGWAWREVLTRKIGIRAWRDRAWEKLLKTTRNHAFERFIATHIPLSARRATQRQEITRCAPDTELWITGSDQVWSPKCALFDPAFFLDFNIPAQARKCSYAASFGTASIPGEQQEEYRRRLQGYAGYSVRESRGATILQELLPHTSCGVHCDPTLLLSRDEWAQLASAQRKSKKFILLYHALPADNQILETANRLSMNTGAELLVLSPYFSASAFRTIQRKCPRVKHAYTSSPADFLALFRDADYVLTSSFHGTAFSILFRKQFLSQIDMLDGMHNGRSEALLQMLGLEGRILTHPGIVSDIDAPIQWARVEQDLNSMREEALHYLRKLVSPKEKD